jgi:hypothetical protein
MEMKYRELKQEKSSKRCPIHHIRPVVNAETDQITIRCCCDFFTGKYISDIENKLMDMTIDDLLDSWETDLLLAELRLN